MVQDNDLLLKYFYKLYLIRVFEEKLDWMFSRNLLPGTAHLCIGQESSAVGSISAINDTDFVVSTHRGHGHLLAKGADPKKLMCEIVGKEPGYCKGLGGTQHLCALEIAFLGTNGITGGGIPFATGVGLALKLQKRTNIVVSFFGDGATNQGVFHESLNMASIWKLPVVYICENNLYAMSTPMAKSMNIKDIAIRAASYGMPGAIADGMSLFEVKKTVSQAVDRARSGQGPTLVELKTYRFCGHSKSDQRCYRTKDEESAWKKKDPIITFEEIMIESGISSESISRVKNEVNDCVEDSYKFAMSAPYLKKEEFIISNG